MTVVPRSVELGLVLTLCFAWVALADEFKTVDGKEYKDAKVTRVEPDGIVVKTKSGISKVYFVELPQDVQRRFNYDPQQARAYSTEQAANYAAIQKQEEEAQHQREEAAAQGQPAPIKQRQEPEPEQQPSGGRSTGGRTRKGPNPAETLTTIPVYEHHEHHEHQTRTNPPPKPAKKPAKRAHE